MHVIVWEFRVKAEREEEFERVYGPEGEWARLFARGTEYIGTELLSDIDERGRYITIDRWISRAAFETFRSRWTREYRTLDQRYEGLTAQETALGTFTLPGR